MRPLEGLRILAVEQYGAGPYGTQLLAELGAEVVKIEAPSMGGDVSRATGPFFLGDQDSQFFQTFSRAKKSLALEIKTPEGRAAFEALVATADAVVNNLRGDQPAKMKLTYADLSAIKPSIVCAHLSAYGRGNSRESWPGMRWPWIFTGQASIDRPSGRSGCATTSRKATSATNGLSKAWPRSVIGANGTWPPKIADHSAVVRGDSAASTTMVNSARFFRRVGMSMKRGSVFSSG